MSESATDQNKNTSSDVNKILPPELLCKIFGVYFSLDEQVNTLSLVCPLWRDIIYNRFLSCKYLHFTDVAQKLVRDYPLAFTSIIHLDVTISNLELLDDLTALFCRVKHLSQINITVDIDLETIEKQYFVVVKTCFSHLTSGLSRLCISCRPSNDTLPVSLLSSAILEQISMNGMSLQTLTDLVCRNVTLSYYGGRRSVLPVIQKFSCLRVLDLSHGGLSVGYNDALGEIIPSLPHICHLDLRYTNITTNDILLENVSQHCSAITFLGLSSRIVARADIVKELIESAHQLKCIKIAECTVRVDTMDTVIVLLQVCTEFKMLRCEGLRYEELMRLASQFDTGRIDTLEGLDLYGSRNSLSDFKLVNLAINIRNLRNIVITSGLNVTNFGVAALLWILPLLQVIHADNVTNIDTALLGKIECGTRQPTSIPYDELSTTLLLLSNTTFSQQMESRGPPPGEDGLQVAGKYRPVCIKW